MFKRMFVSAFEALVAVLLIYFGNLLLTHFGARSPSGVAGVVLLIEGILLAIAVCLITARNILVYVFCPVFFVQNSGVTRWDAFLAVVLIDLAFLMGAVLGFGLMVVGVTVVTTVYPLFLKGVVSLVIFSIGFSAALIFTILLGQEIVGQIRKHSLPRKVIGGGEE